MFGNGYDGGYDGGGGFDTSGFGGGETPVGDKKGFKRTEQLVPVTARQVVDSPETGLKIGRTDMDVQMVKIVGIVKKIVRSSVKITYTVEDITASIQGIHWLEANDDDNYVIPVVENSYCTMIGSIRNKAADSDEKHVMVFQIFPVTDLNEVTAHYLQIVYISLKSEDLAQQTPLPPAKREMSSTYGGMDSSVGGGSDYAAGFNLNPQQHRVLKAVAQTCHSEMGSNIDDIMGALTVKMPAREVEKILEFLSNEGHVYSTSDDKHYKATDGVD